VGGIPLAVYSTTIVGVLLLMDVGCATPDVPVPGLMVSEGAGELPL